MAHLALLMVHRQLAAWNSLTDLRRLRAELSREDRREPLWVTFSSMRLVCTTLSSRDRSEEAMRPGARWPSAPGGARGVTAVSKGSVLLALCLLGCGGTATLPAPERRASAPRAARAGPLPALPEGECGGFAALEPGPVVSLLGDRVRLRSFVGLGSQHRPVNIMAAPPSARTETRLFASLDDSRRFVVFAQELFATADELVAELNALPLEGGSVYPLPDTSAAVFVPDELDTSDEAVEVLRLYTRSRDSYVQSIRFYVTPPVAETGGCRALALSLARTVTQGERRLHLLTGPRTLQPGLGLTLPQGFHLSSEGAHDFSVYQVHADVALRDAPAELGIYVGHHPSGPERGDREVPGEVLGQPVQWQVTESEAGQDRQTLFLIPNTTTYLHIFLHARSPGRVDELMAVVASLTTDPPRRQLEACDAGPRPTSELTVQPGSELAVLMDAPSFTGLAATWVRPTVAESEAFRALLDTAAPGPALRHLALHANTVEGQLYGLAGLRLVDPEQFRDVLCAVRAELPARAHALTPCGTEPLDVAATLESAAPDAIRGEPHWGPLEWGIAFEHGTPDIRGGGLPRSLLDTGHATHRLWSQAGRLLGHGFLPPLRPGDPEPPPLMAGTRQQAAPPSLSNATGPGGCSVRRDGRVACWGGERPGEERAERAILLPDVLRYPPDLSTLFGAGCMLDAEGTRVCWGGIEQSARLRAEACGGPAPASLILRRYDDGPWARLVIGAIQRGAIHRDGSLHGFANEPTYVPSWAEPDREHGTYRVPIDGRVVGAIPSVFDSFAWTDDGRIFRYDRQTRPHELGRFEGVVAGAVGLGRALYAELADGRVMAYQSGEREWYSPHGSRLEAWREIAPLRGARVFLGAYHGCGAFPDGRVLCFGSAAGFEPDADSFEQRPPTEVPALRGAQTLVIGQRSVCGWMRNQRLRCVGTQLPEGPGWTRRGDLTELDVRVLSRRATETARPTQSAP